MTKFIVANWKMHFTAKDAEDYFAAFAGFTKGMSLDQVVFCTPATLYHVAGKIAKTQKFNIGAQNMHHEPKGAYSGELSAPMIVDAGATYVLVGHSERRLFFGETDEGCAKKMGVAIANNLVPILCIGETVEEKTGGQTETVLRTQLETAFGGIDWDTAKNVMVAYEPVWAISGRGTGLTATNDEITRIHAFLRKEIDALAKNKLEIPLFFGGSVNGATSAEIMAIPHVDGVLVGGASLKPDDFAKIVGAGQ